MYLEETVEVKMTTKNWGSEVSWTLGAACGSPSTGYASFADNTQSCTLLTGVYTLTCLDSYGDGWHGGFIEIQGAKYCDDFSRESSATAQVTITGIDKYTNFRFSDIIILYYAI